MNLKFGESDGKIFINKFAQILFFLLGNWKYCDHIECPVEKQVLRLPKNKSVVRMCDSVEGVGFLEIFAF